jgi:hypothetical protein
MKRVIPLLVFVLPLIADAPGEWVFLEADADPLWQEAIGVFYTRDTSLVLYDTTITARRVAFESYDPSDTQYCPMSAFGYYDFTIRRAYCSYPVVSICDSFAKIIYNVNSGKCGWLRLTEKTEIIMLSDTMAFRSMEVIYLAAIGATNYHSVAYYDKPGGKVTRYNTILPFTPPGLEQRIPSGYRELPKTAYADMISIRGYKERKLSLGTIAKIKGDWVQLGRWDEELMLNPTNSWIRIRDKQGRLLVWFVRVMRI